MATNEDAARDCIKDGYGDQPAGIEWIMARPMEESWDPFSEAHPRQPWMTWPTVESLMAKVPDRFNPLVITTAMSVAIKLLIDLGDTVTSAPVNQRIRLAMGQLWSAHQYLMASVAQGLDVTETAGAVEQCKGALAVLCDDLRSQDDSAGYHAVKAVLVALEDGPTP